MFFLFFDASTLQTGSIPGTEAVVNSTDALTFLQLGTGVLLLPPPIVCPEKRRYHLPRKYAITSMANPQTDSPSDSRASSMLMLRIFISPQKTPSYCGGHCW